MAEGTATTYTLRSPWHSLWGETSMNHHSRAKRCWWALGILTLPILLAHGTRVCADEVFEWNETAFAVTMAGGQVSAMVSRIPLNVPAGRHCGFRPRSWSAWARTSESCSLSSASVSNPARSDSAKRPSVLRSMSCCNRSFALGGKRKSLTNSIHSTGAETVAPTVDSPCKSVNLYSTTSRLVTILISMIAQANQGQ
jgi:hypothetical protein